MKTELEQILESLPNEVKFEEITEFEKLDERISAVGVLYANTIGVCEGFIEFCPDNEPPLLEEKLSWIWTIKPNLGIDIQKQNVSENLKMLITSYQKDELDKFWDYISE